MLWAEQLAVAKLLPVAMGPCVRRDDTEGVIRRNLERASYDARTCQNRSVRRAFSVVMRA